MIKLLDANLLLALAWRNHEHHERATRWRRDGNMKTWATCALTQLAFIRLSSNSMVIPGAVSPKVAADFLGRLTDRPGHRPLESPCPVADISDAGLFDHIQGYRQVTDLYLLSLANRNDAKLATLDHRLEAISPWPHTVEAIP